MARAATGMDVDPPEKPEQLPAVTARLAQTTDLVRADLARLAFGLSGKGLSVAVLDTGIRATHADFAGRVVAQRNFTSDNGGDPNDASDGHGHGTNVTGIIAANGVNVGIAPGAGIIALKVLNNNGTGTFEAVNRALAWVLENRLAYNIAVVNMSLTGGGNYTSLPPSQLQGAIRSLRDAGVAVVIAAGNKFYEHGSAQGMAYPAIYPECISVGATYDADIGAAGFSGGAYSYSTGPSRLTAFSQRLSGAMGTDVFAPGANLTSTGNQSDQGRSTMRGTSQATPVVAGAILLVQEYHMREHGLMPTVGQVSAFIDSGAVPIIDGDDEDDNVVNTGATFDMLDVLGTLMAAAGSQPIRPIITSSMTVDPVPVIAGMPVKLSAHAVGFGHDDLAYSWDFGDGTTGYGHEVVHVFAADGRYEVSVLVSDDMGHASDIVTVVSLPASTLVVRNMRASVRFDAARGRMRVRGTLPESTYWPQRVTVGVGLERYEFYASRGVSRSGGNKVIVRRRRFSFVTTGAGVAAAMGMNNADADGEQIDVAILLGLEGGNFVAHATLSYYAKKGRFGRAWLSR
jgi:hypothetical protein